MPSPLPTILATSERDALRRTVAAYLDEALPVRRVAELDEGDAFPRDVWEGLGGLGVLGIGVPEELGGGGGSAADSLAVVIEVARRYPSLAVDYVLCGMVARMLSDHGTAAQREWLEPLAEGRAIYAYGISEPDSGTDALACRTRAVEDGDCWRVDGAKLWTSLAAESELIFTLARTGPPVEGRRGAGISVVAVPTRQDGVRVRRVHLAGMRGAGTCEVTFDGALAPGDALVGPRDRGFSMLRQTLNVERILSAGISIGIGSAALELAVAYAGQRQAFGRPIGAFQAVQHPLVDAATALAGAMLLTERAVVLYETGQDATATSGMAKMAAGEAAAEVVDRGMRAMAAMGLARETPMQMLFRDARLQLFSPVSNEMIRNLLGEAMGLPRSY
jgi:alkylation response protein AidB-like acyl-CoA dehydrogenase